jgi:hypothetical protein
MAIIAALSLLSAAAQTSAEAAPLTPIDDAPIMIEIQFADTLPTGRDLRFDRWSIKANGKVTNSGERCPGCRWHQPYSESYRIDPATVEQTRAMLELGLFRKAADAPCRLAGAGKVFSTAYVSVFVDIPGASAMQSSQFIASCESPEVEAANLRIAEALAMVKAAKPQ